MKIVTLLGAGVMVSGALFAAEQNFTFDKPADWSGKNMPVVADGALISKGKGIVESKQIFDLAPGKKYTLSFKMRRGAGSPAVSNYIGFALKDAKGGWFNPMWSNPIGGSDGELAADVKPGDRVIKVKSAAAAKWGSLKAYWGVAFDAKSDMSDLPNRQLSPMINPKACKKAGDVYEVAFNGGMNKAYPAGTKVRVHSAGGYFYTFEGNAPTEWKEFKTTISEFSAAGQERGKWWKGAGKARLVMLTNWTGKDADKGVVEIKDIKLSIE